MSRPKANLKTLRCAQAHSLFNLLMCSAQISFFGATFCSVLSKSGLSVNRILVNSGFVRGCSYLFKLAINDLGEQSESGDIIRRKDHISKLPVISRRRQ